MATTGDGEVFIEGGIIPGLNHNIYTVYTIYIYVTRDISENNE